MRFGAEQPTRSPEKPRGSGSVFGDAVFGDAVPVTSGSERTEVIRRGSEPERASRDAQSPEIAAPETVRVPERVPPADDDADDRAWWNSPDDDGGVPKPPGEAGLSWADDPIARRLAPKTPVAPVSEKKQPDPRMRWIIGGVAAAVLLVVALVLTIGLVKRGGDDPGVTAAPVPSSAVAGKCQPVAEQAVTVGAGPGDTTSGAKAILGLQYAFYVERSGAQVRQYVAPDAENISSAETIQAAIDNDIPVGTQHCVKMRETSVGHFDVELREWHPDGTEMVYKQEIVTTNTDGKWQVKSVIAIPK
ncbi:hypothetical protein ACFO5K_26165 [Nocardia halotolerans]|uniref:DUF8176 domain-containing protein n=1 Tax=Nocardia halotolerans TaxID=1755878 RepID=A0ABV8VT38_9NOCA